ncbi:hypothetical protein CcaverHIS002_0107920 [Cutaneotrichosporon cavernicola]|uniref:CMP/dCMP-type deaminase domain-containing protein n=1 Tax=Cutaneotrichosporon cavernicola TaxID=279322 RepID=A0AA48KXA5_9TREE|nr:uncharacterized protein CcaverHIS019_0107870 [Cutaneotrichosporon cavernicola]BEI80263.1 hypothetical protein CcaverHIS002_0107920 [Cutaneotrichosporon cavernicola]BEI88069.1 hypothetical protein CcaverHIS019_0107870 [Cutaneotrichosporon cavernicola]BEI95840.1 hypothetical protein CcaverHIS631_0107890 [Cutaneotrichosporon cavernicola]BEJ03614.1 hypothetical protein CcaverHIS641_0107890 [Cutaneotrichosporon cavernicola]
MSPSPSALLDALLHTTTDAIIPLTADGVRSGCKVFGAAILRKSDLGLVIAATNHETASPLLHGEINCIQQFYGMGDHPNPKDCVFFATHEPCSLCLSGITWSGFDNFYYLFTYQDTRDAFAIPHDIKILEEVFKVRAGGETDEQYAARELYNRENAFFKSKSVAQLVDELPEAQREAANKRIAQVKDTYDRLSEVYQQDKGKAGIPLA